MCTGSLRPGSLRSGVRHAVDVARRGREAGADAARARRGAGAARRSVRRSVRLGRGAECSVACARLGWASPRAVRHSCVLSCVA